MFNDESKHLAAQLPDGINDYMDGGGKEKYSIDEFFEKISEREGVDKLQAAYHARVVLFDVIRDSVSPGEVDHLVDTLPKEYKAVITSGSQGEMDIR